MHPPWPSWAQLVSRTAATVYCNVATSSPLLNVVKQGILEELDSDAMSCEPWKTTEYWMSQTRDILSQLLGITPSTLTITHNTTQGLQLVLNGLRWNHHEEILLSSNEHASAIVPSLAIRERYGVTVRVVDIDQHRSSSNLLDYLESSVGSSTRLLVISHVTWNTGQQRDLTTLCQWARRHGIKTLIDGAQGMGRVTMNQLLTHGVCDAYAFSGHKWLCGPPGTGALWIHPSWVEELWSSQSGSTGITAFSFMGLVQWQAGAQRFESSTRNAAILAGWYKGLQYIQRWGLALVNQRIMQLSQTFFHQVYHCTTLSQQYAFLGDAGIITMVARSSPNTWDPRPMMMALRQKGIICRVIGRPHGLRFSLHAFNTTQEIVRVVQDLAWCLKQLPSISETRSNTLSDWWTE